MVRPTPLLILSVVCVASCEPAQITPTADPARDTTHLARVQSLTLDSIARPGLVVYFSEGRQPRGEAVLSLVDSMIAYFQPIYGPLPLRVAVLDTADWRATLENPYGVPGVRHPGPIAFMPADIEDGVLYRDVLRLTASLPQEMRERIERDCGSLAICTMTFADLIVLHEIAHAYVDRTFARPNLWLGEFAPDYLVYTYLRTTGNPNLVAWNLMNEVTAQIPPNVASLADFELRRKEPNSLATLTPEFPRLHGILMERIPEVYEKFGDRFLPHLTASFPPGHKSPGLSHFWPQCGDLSIARVIRGRSAPSPRAPRAGIRCLVTDLWLGQALAPPRIRRRRFD